MRLIEGMFYLITPLLFVLIEPMCRHIRKGLEQGNLKRALLNVEWNICQDCKTDNKVKDKSEEETEETPSVWLCLKCGHQVCLDFDQYGILKNSLDLF